MMGVVIIAVIAVIAYTPIAVALRLAGIKPSKRRRGRW